MKTDYNDLLYRFTEHLKILNRSPRTISTYNQYIKNFVEAVKTEDIKGIHRTKVESYISSLYEYRYKRYKGGEKDRPYSISSVSIMIRAIKRFFEYLEAINVIFINPCEGIKEPKTKKILPKDILTHEEAAKILEAPNLGTRMGIRDRAILETLYSTGIRRMEVCSLSIFDVDIQGGFLRINKGKGSKDRVVPLGRHALRFLKGYIHKIRPYLTRTRKARKGARRPLKRKQTRILFLNKDGEPVTAGTVQQLVRRYRIQAKIKKHITIHCFRHTFAVRLIKNGADIRAVQKMMGHSKLSTTQEYTRLAGTKIKKDHQKCHPREQDKEGAIVKPEIKRKRPLYE